MKIKHLLLIISSITIITACQDELVLPADVTKTPVAINTTNTGKVRVAVSSREELKNIISQLEYTDAPMSRVASGVKPGMDFLPFDKTGDSIFVSLVEANRQKVMSTLTEAQLEEIRNDEDELEFCPEDSIIADIRFAMLLNKDREIQVGDTVFRYFANGIAFTLACHQSELDSLKDLIPTIEFNPSETVGGAHTTNVGGSHVEFMPIYFSTVRDVSMIDHGGSVPILTEEDYKDLSEIPARDIRDIYYTPGKAHNAGDGNWYHRTWTGMWGENVTAINKFTDNKKLTLNFYDQNYYLYATIGTTLKMQKRVCGIWWNIKAEKMVQGWETVTIQYTKPEPISPNTFTHPTWQNPTITLNHSHPFGMSQTTLFYIPFTDYSITAGDVTKAYKIAIDYAYKKASAWAKKQIKSTDNMGLMTVNGNNMYTIHGPTRLCAQNVGKLDTKFHTKAFSGYFNIDFSIGSSFQLKSIKFDKDDGVDLFSGCVYGAIKYNDKWLAARITKYREPKE
ncbi:MAG: hypothetical protein K2L90_00550 [Muribaculaceae bacterium]|nr:hypothetical protein [Muribaculaceae bacterium]